MKQARRSLRRWRDKIWNRVRHRGPGLDHLPPPDVEHGWTIPEQDFIDKSYDFEESTAPRRLLLLLSTPRSGSTYLSDLLRSAGIGVPHEYFQASQYMQLLNERWSFADPVSREIDWQAFAESLRASRTSANGWLSINLHGSHLARFSRAAAQFSDLDWVVVHLRRTDIVSQALSLCEARATRKWSASFDAASEWSYDYDKVEAAIADIQRQNLLIDAFVKSRGIEARSISFDSIRTDPVGVVASMAGLDEATVARAFEESAATIVRQSDAKARKALQQRFEREFLQNNGIMPA